MLEASTSRSKAEQFFVGYINKIIMSLFYKNHTAPKKAQPFGKTSGVAKLFSANEEECTNALKDFSNNKTPGTDFLPAEFY